MTDDHGRPLDIVEDENGVTIHVLENGARTISLTNRTLEMALASVNAHTPHVPQEEPAPVEYVRPQIKVIGA